MIWDRVRVRWSKWLPCVPHVSLITGLFVYLHYLHSCLFTPNSHISLLSISKQRHTCVCVSKFTLPSSWAQHSFLFPPSSTGQLWTVSLWLHRCYKIVSIHIFVLTLNVHFQNVQTSKVPPDTVWQSASSDHCNCVLQKCKKQERLFTKTYCLCKHEQLLYSRQLKPSVKAYNIAPSVAASCFFLGWLYENFTWNICHL